jgi:hypothetical protein
MQSLIPCPITTVRHCSCTGTSLQQFIIHHLSLAIHTILHSSSIVSLLHSTPSSNSILPLAVQFDSHIYIFIYIHIHIYLTYLDTYLSLPTLYTSGIRYIHTLPVDPDNAVPVSTALSRPRLRCQRDLSIFLDPRAVSFGPLPASASASESSIRSLMHFRQPLSSQPVYSSPIIHFPSRKWR